MVFTFRMLSGPELELPKSRFAFDFEDCGFETILFVLCGVFTGSAWAQENKRRGERSFLLFVTL